MNEITTRLEKTIEKFEDALKQMNEATRESHSTLKELRNERREIERLLSSKELKKKVNDQVDKVVKSELENILPDVKQQCELLYDKIGIQIDKLIDLSLGKEFAMSHGRKDIRPELAAKLREFILEIVNKEQS